MTERSENGELHLLWAAIALATLFLLNGADYDGGLQPWIVPLLLLGGAGALLAPRAPALAQRLGLLSVVGAAWADRIVRPTAWHISDVVDATREALTAWFAGENPYLHVFLTTRPPHSPFPYLPGELLFYGIPYALFHTIDAVDKWAGLGVILLLAALAPIVGSGRAALGIAMYALFSLAGAESIVGSNDGSLTFLLIASFVMLAWSEHDGSHRLSRACFYASAVMLAWALLFKALAWPFLPFLAAHLFAADRGAARRYLITVSAICALVMTPFLIISPVAMLANVQQGFVFHNGFFMGLNVWVTLQRLGVRLDPHASIISLADNIVVLSVFLTLLRRPDPSLGGTMLRGAATVITALLLAHYSPFSYYTFAGDALVAGFVLLNVRTTMLATRPSSTSSPNDPAPTTNAATPAPRLDVLDGLRGLAIVLVFAFHAWPLSYFPPRIGFGSAGVDLSAIVRTGFWGVELFFFLSGFCLFHPYALAHFTGRPRPTLGHFAYRRAIKIAPSYLIAIVGAILLGNATFSSTGDMLRQLALHLTFLHPWFSDSFFAISGVMWSLGVEVEFYLLFPLFAWCMLRKPYLTAGFLLALATVDRLTIMHLHPWDTNRFMALLPAKIDLFAAGMLAAYLFQFIIARSGDKALPRLGWTAIALGGLALYAATAAWVYPFGNQPSWPNEQQPYALPLLDLAFIAVTLGSLFGLPAWRRLLANRVLAFFALISYNLYLWHAVIAVDLPRRGAIRPWPIHDPHLFLIAFFAVPALYAITLATMITFLIERPLLRMR